MCPAFRWWCFNAPHHSSPTAVILQNHFDILLGSIEVTVPWVVDGDDYSIIRAYSYPSPLL